MAHKPAHLRDAYRAAREADQKIITQMTYHKHMTPAEDGQSIKTSIKERELKEKARERRGKAESQPVTRIEIDILAAQVRQNEMLIQEVKNLTRQLHEFHKQTDFQYARLVEEK